MSISFTPLSEQTSLGDREQRDPLWGHRLTTEEPETQLGDMLVLNAMVSPDCPSLGSLVPDGLVEAAEICIATAAMHEDDETFLPLEADSEPEPPYLTIDQASAITDIDFGRMPAAFRSWRFDTEIYLLVGRMVYLVLDLPVRHKVLGGTELGITYSERLLPFGAIESGGESDHETDVAVFIVAVPGRRSALGGLRGFLTAMVRVGEGLAWFRQASDEADQAWRWSTEFYDDAANRVLSIDGVERFVVAIGSRVTLADDTGNPEEEHDDD